jgi:hypothetical protein
MDVNHTSRFHAALPTHGPSGCDTSGRDDAADKHDEEDRRGEVP